MGCGSQWMTAKMIFTGVMMVGLRMGRKRYGALAGFGGLLLLTGCVSPLAPEEVKLQAKADVESIFSGQEPITGPLTLDQAMARAIAYNLDSRQYAYEQALSNRQYDLSLFDLMPKMDVNAGVNGRSSKDASNSETLSTGERGSYSYSDDTGKFTSDLGVVFSLLDFGVSYVSSRQAANQALIADQRRRLVTHTIIQDVRGAYWRTLAAQRLLGKIGPLMERVAKARRQSEIVAEQRLGSPLDALAFKRTLLEIQQQLESQRQEMSLAELELASLISAPLATNLLVADPGVSQVPPQVPLPVSAMEEVALTHRPELMEEHYKARISRQETWKSILRLLPGIELDAGYNFDSDSFLLNNHWATYGAKVSLNLFRLIQGPSAIKAAWAGEDLADARRLALSMAVLTQVHVAQANFQEAKRRFGTAQDLYEVDTAIRDQVRDEFAAGRVGDLPVIRAELNQLRAELTRDLSYAQVQNAYGRLFQVMGADPLPQSLPSQDITSLAKGVGAVQKDWREGRFHLPGEEKPVMGGPATPPSQAAIPVSMEPVRSEPVPPMGSRTMPVTRQTANGLAVFPGG
jgi:outer membrane protein TolC